MCSPFWLQKKVNVCFAMRCALGVMLLLIFSALPTQAQSAEDVIDVVDYKIDAELIPETQTLAAKAVVTLKVARQVQSVTLELNGSLEVTKVTGPNNEPLQFVQDRLQDLSVKVALGQSPVVGQPFTLTFEYAGQLLSSEGGVLALKRLAYVGKEGCYLLYAARWFPFHAYASDVATYTINLVTPSEFKVVAFGEHTEQPFVLPAPVKAATGKQTDSAKPPTRRQPAGSRRKPAQPAETEKATTEALQSPSKPLPTGSGNRTRHTFVVTQPLLPGTIAAGEYSVRSIQRNGFDVDFYFKIGNESSAERYAEIMAEAGSFLNQKFGPYAFGTKLQVAEIDNESLESYTAAGVTLLARRLLDNPKELPRETLIREVAYQWWGQAVGLKSFDDIWISQGLATYCYMLFEQSQMNQQAFTRLCRDILERALAFESQTSIGRAPAELDDQSAAYRSIIFYKGAFVFRMLSSVLGEAKMATLLKNFYAENQGKRPGISDFERATSKVAGEDMRYFFGQWVDSTGVPEFRPDYQILRLKDGSYRLRGTIEQDLETLRFPLDIELESKGGIERTQVQINGKSVDFTLKVNSEPGNLNIDPDSKLLRTSEEVRVAVVVRRGIQHMEQEEYAEAQQQFEAAIKLNRRSSWAYYNLGLLYMKQQNFQRAIDAFDEAYNGNLIPSWIEVWSLLYKGMAYDAAGQRDRAVAEYDKVQKLGDNPDNVQDLAQKYMSAPYRPERSTPSNP